MREGSDLVVAARVSFEDFYLKDYQAVVGLAYALSGSRWLAEDLAQEAFLAAHRNWPRVSAYDQPGAWVRRVVANLSVSAFRRRMVEAKALVRLGLASATSSPSSHPTTPSSGRRSGRCRDANPRWWRCTTSTTSRSPRSRRSWTWLRAP